MRTVDLALLWYTKVYLTIGHTVLRFLNADIDDLVKQWHHVQHWYNIGQTQQVQGYMDNHRMWVPMMMFSGIMNAVFFMSMMSMLGMALTRAESGLAGGEGAGAAAESGEAAGAEDSGGAGADSGGGA